MRAEYVGAVECISNFGMLHDIVHKEVRRPPHIGGMLLITCVVSYMSEQVSAHCLEGAVIATGVDLLTSRAFNRPDNHADVCH